MANVSTLDQAYLDAQIKNVPERNVEAQALKGLSENWKAADIPALQRSVVEVQLKALHRGAVDPVFQAFQRALKCVDLVQFRLLDAACASGYYSEALQVLDQRKIEYVGSDYSPSMVELAQRCYPHQRFEVQDLTRLTFAEKSFSVVMAAGVIEHVPNYTQALREICRVASDYVIIHRSPVTNGKNHEFTVGSQYSIETPRIFFSEKKLVTEFATLGFALTSSFEVYPTIAPRLSLKSRLKGWVRAALGRQLQTRTTRTLVFRRV